MKKNNYIIKLFFKRLLAFIIDTTLISILSVFIASPFIDYKSISNLEENSNQIMEDYVNEKINNKQFIDCSKPIIYRLYQHEGIVFFVSLVLNVLYFVVFQYYKNGQTLGKKIFRIKVVSSNNKDISMNTYIYRSFIINSVIIDIFMFILLIFSNENIWFYGMMSFGFLKFIILLVCGLMSISNNDGRGLHDIICNTKVVSIEG